MSHRGYTIRAELVAEGRLSGYEVFVVTVTCTGASQSTDVLSMFAGTVHGPELVGRPIAPNDVMRLHQTGFMHDQFYIEAYGYTSQAPMCCPDLAVTRWFRLTSKGLKMSDETILPSTPN